MARSLKGTERCLVMMTSTSLNLLPMLLIASRGEKALMETFILVFLDFFLWWAAAASRALTGALALGVSSASAGSSACSSSSSSSSEGESTIVSKAQLRPAPMAMPAHREAAGESRSTRRIIFDEKYPEMTEKASRNHLASVRLNRQRKAPAGPMKQITWKYLQYTSLGVAWCSATESTNGLPVLVCLMNKLRTRTEMGPTLSVLMSQPTKIAQPSTNRATSFQRNSWNWVLDIRFLHWVTISRPCIPRNTASGPICSMDSKGCQPTMGT
mmetsp:Transcript_8482/g.19509  ORF Transcript_8482/g.19509 Transcript_8482/m.19509 type:complete len:270 (+) Transcript_8482:903-1712(+)